jgi:hypothetical protein
VHFERRSLGLKRLRSLTSANSVGHVAATCARCIIKTTIPCRRIKACSLAHRGSRPGWQARNSGDRTRAGSVPVGVGRLSAAHPGASPEAHGREREAP